MRPRPGPAGLAITGPRGPPRPRIIMPRIHGGGPVHRRPRPGPPGLGMPFPWGLRWLSAAAPRLTTWAWAINGCTSVIASVLAALLALQFGFSAVLLLGAGSYALAAVMVIDFAQD